MVHQTPPESFRALGFLRGPFADSGFSLNFLYHRSRTPHGLDACGLLRWAVLCGNSAMFLSLLQLTHARKRASACVNRPAGRERELEPAATAAPVAGGRETASGDQKNTCVRHRRNNTFREAMTIRSRLLCVICSDNWLKRHPGDTSNTAQKILIHHFFGYPPYDWCARAL